MQMNHEMIATSKRRTIVDITKAYPYLKIWPLLKSVMLNNCRSHLKIASRFKIKGTIFSITRTMGILVNKGLG